jgi:predicted secreted protein
MDFHDCRSKRVIFLTHCHLNQNARLARCAESPAATRTLAEGLLAREVGIVQMPCPELMLMGLNRGHIAIRSGLETFPAREALRRLARDIVFQVQQYQSCGVQVLGILGKDGSPSCGVETTSRSDGKGSIAGSGVFVEVLQEELRSAGCDVPVAGTRDDRQPAALEVVDRWLAGRTS